jgi:hypothetical protein
MEIVRLAGTEVTVREVSRPAGKRLCRHLISDDDQQHFLEYVISVGPYKIDLPVAHPLTEAQVSAHMAGTLQLGELAEQLADADERSGRFERTP